MEKTNQKAVTSLLNHVSHLLLPPPSAGFFRVSPCLFHDSCIPTPYLNCHVQVRRQGLELGTLELGIRRQV